MKFKEDFGRLIRELREGESLTQEQLAYDVGMSPSYLSTIENGSANPTFNVLEKLGNRLGFSIILQKPVKKEKSPNKGSDSAANNKDA